MAYWKMEDKDNTQTIGRDDDNIKNKHKYGQTRTKVSVKHQPYIQAFKNASLKLALSIISPRLAYIVV